MRQRRFNMRVYVDKVDGTRTCRGEDTKIIALREQGIERTESIRPRIVATGDVCLGAESWFQRNGRKPVIFLFQSSVMADALLGYTAKRQGGCTYLATILMKAISRQLTARC